MPSWDDVEVGDEIVAEVHGVVRKISTTRWQIDVEPERSAMTRGVFPMTDTLKSVEKPVRTFKPGDVLRPRENPRPAGLLYIVPANSKSLRYVHPGYPGDLYISTYSVEQATSELFELVEG